jgi:hypothetical protein
VYCNGLQTKNTTTIHFKPGTYYINQGDFVLSSATTADCPTCTGTAGVTFVLTSTAGGSTVGSATIDGSAKVTLNAPTDPSYPYPSVLIYQDRAFSGTSKPSFTSGTNINIKGALYFPSSTISFGGNTTMTNTCATVIGKKVNFTGSVSLNLSPCPSGSGYVQPTVPGNALVLE